MRGRNKKSFDMFSVSKPNPNVKEMFIDEIVQKNRIEDQ